MSGVFSIEMPPKRGQPYRVVFSLRTSAGELVTGWKNPKATVQRSGGKVQKLADPVESRGGIGYVELTAKHTDAPHVVVKVEVSNADALPFVKLVTMARNED